jgi:tetratricopeptide (TPR) repeat protein
MSPEEKKDYLYLRLGRTNVLLKDYKEAKKYLKNIQNDTAYVLLGWVLIQEGKMEESKKEFKKITNHKWRKLGENFFKMKKGKNEIIGIVWSIIPGAGRIYAGRVYDGIMSFPLTIGPIGLGYYYWRKDKVYLGSIFFGLGGLFYLANFYGGRNAVKEYNERIERKKLETLRDGILGAF